MTYYPLVYPASDTVRGRAIELYHILRLSWNAPVACWELTQPDSAYNRIWNSYWNACEKLGMVTGESHPLDGM